MAPTDKASYSFFTEVMLRFSDLDVAGHVNNAVYATLFESARCEVLLDGNKWIEPSDMGFVMRRLEIDFLQSVRFPATRAVTIGTTVTAIGETSVTFQQAMFVDEQCCALSKSVMVLISAKGKEKIPDGAKQRLREKTGATIA